MKEEFTRFEPADYLISEAEREAYLNAAIEEEDPYLLTVVLSDIAKARGIEESKTSKE
ncbi:helix-turn-helix domain-containing transcriptional regulator [Aeromonas mytilicola]